MSNVFIERVDGFPTWALPCLINGDVSGISSGEMRMVEKWERPFRDDPDFSHFAVESDDGFLASYFERTPEFGLACECVEVQAVYIKKEEVA